MAEVRGLMGTQLQSSLGKLTPHWSWDGLAEISRFRFDSEQPPAVFSGSSYGEEIALKVREDLNFFVGHFRPSFQK